MFFKKITVAEWQQFENVEIGFSNQLTIVTGANGSGKTSILNILARHSGWQYPSFSIPRKEEKSGIISYITRYFSGQDKSDLPKIGELQYDDDSHADLLTQKTDSAQYHIKIKGQKEVQCFYIPSHRAVPKYQQIENIPTHKKSKLQAFQEVFENNKQRYFGDNNRSSTFFMKAALMGWATQGYGVRSRDGTIIMPADNELARYFEGFPKVLKSILPASLGFEKIEIRNSEIVFICNGGNDEFILETVSGGIYALIDIAWQIYMYATEDQDTFTVIIDEVENHLHPSMQRQILGDLIRAFPAVRFIVSTHSPLIVNSVKAAEVYALVYNENKKIVSKRLDFRNQAKTASEILDEVLGVSFTMPIWVENKLQEIVKEYSKKAMTEEDFKSMRNELKEVGLERLIPSAITGILEKKND